MADQGASQQRPAGWKKDPSGRYYGRYWDGQQWTDQVVSAERVQSVDPLPPRPEPAIFPAGAPPAPAGGAAPAQTEKPAVQWRGPAPTAPGWTQETRRLRGPVPVRPPEDDPQGKGTNQVVVAVRGWPSWAKWAAGAAVVLLLIAAAAGGGEDKDKPVPVVGEVETTLTLPVTTTVVPTTQLATTIPATTQAPTTVTIPATTQAPAPATTTAPRVQQGVTPGAFCSPGGASGVTNTGVAMTCTTSATDSRNRWRAA